METAAVTHALHWLASRGDVCKLSFVESVCSCVCMHMGVGVGGAYMDLDYSLYRQDFALNKYFIIVECTLLLLLLNAYYYY